MMILHMQWHVGCYYFTVLTFFLRNLFQTKMAFADVEFEVIAALCFVAA